MVRKRGKLSGLLLKEPSMDFSHQNPLIFSLKRVTIESYLRLQSRPKDVPKLQGLMNPSFPQKFILFKANLETIKISFVFVFVGFGSCTRSKDM